VNGSLTRQKVAPRSVADIASILQLTPRLCVHCKMRWLATRSKAQALSHAVGKIGLRVNLDCRALVNVNLSRSGLAIERLEAFVLADSTQDGVASSCSRFKVKVNEGDAEAYDDVASLVAALETTGHRVSICMATNVTSMALGLCVRNVLPDGCGTPATDWVLLSQSALCVEPGQLQQGSRIG
jgi:hypothetical protein